MDIRNIIKEEISSYEATPEYYLNNYTDDMTFKGINHDTGRETIYTGEQYRELFNSWYNKIRPFLEVGDVNGVHNVLVNWNEETLAKFDLYSLVRKYFQNKL